jgi:pyrimidine operon attenuation protein/uracil phosphoribosyltransferase
MPRTLLMPPSRVRRTLRRIAAEVVERNRGGERLLVFGVRRRGLALAERLAEALEEVAGRPFPVHPLDVAPFRDDRPEGVPPPASPPGPEVEAHDVLIVDDVLFTGRTARAAIDAVLPLGRPRTIQLAVLVDRGHREVPIQPDYVGRVIPTKYGERVVVEVEEAPEVYLEE